MRSHFHATLRVEGQPGNSCESVEEVDITQQPSLSKKRWSHLRSLQVVSSRSCGAVFFNSKRLAAFQRHKVAADCARLFLHSVRTLKAQKISPQPGCQLPTSRAHRKATGESAGFD